MLTARGDAADRIVGLELGRRRLLPSLSSRATLARLRAILRRGKSRGRAPSCASGALKSTANRARAVDGQERALTGYQFALLVALAENAGPLLSRETLMDLVKASRWKPSTARSTCTCRAPRGDRERPQEAAAPSSPSAGGLCVCKAKTMRRLYLRIYLASSRVSPCSHLAAGLLWDSFATTVPPAGAGSRGDAGRTPFPRRCDPPSNQAAARAAAADLRADVALFGHGAARFGGKAPAERRESRESGGWVSLGSRPYGRAAAPTGWLSARCRAEGGSRATGF